MYWVIRWFWIIQLLGFTLYESHVLRARPIVFNSSTNEDPVSWSISRSTPSRIRRFRNIILQRSCSLVLTLPIFKSWIKIVKYDFRKREVCTRMCWHLDSNYMDIGHKCIQSGDVITQSIFHLTINNIHLIAAQEEDARDVYCEFNVCDWCFPLVTT